MRLISMEKGGNLSSVYSRLVKAVTEVEKKIRFSRHRRFGFLTFCPTNLGTTIRASVHARFPKLCEDYERFTEIANMYNLQVRNDTLSSSFFFFSFLYRIIRVNLLIYFTYKWQGLVRIFC